MTPILRTWLLPAVLGLILGALVAALWQREPSTGAQTRPGHADAVARAAPSVVNIYSTVHERPPACLREPRLKPWCERMSGTDRTSLGSGVVIHPDGFIVTNAHVINGASDILVMLADGRTAQAELVGSDAFTDLAVIRVPLKALAAITLGDPTTVAVGDVALAIGNPFGIGQTVSAGIISATGRASISPSPYDDFLQTDAAINPGNSGGALIDADGRLIGINTLIISPTGEGLGVGFALPADLAYGILEEIIEHGRVTRGWLGLTLANPIGQVADGIIVSGIEPDGPAAAAGLRPMDLITRLNGERMQDPNGFSRRIGRTRPGESVRLEVERSDGEGPRTRLDITVVAGSRPAGDTPAG